MAYENDPPEFTGTTRSIPADPVRKTQAATAATTAKPGSHAKVAIVAPRKAWLAATQETADARSALIQITASHRAAENAESDAMTAWMAHPLNRPNPDAVTRAYLAREGAMREANVKAGLPANHRGPVAATNRAPIEQAAIARGRHAGGTAQKAGVPLRSNIARRTV